jgi:hypothetical protein
VRVRFSKTLGFCDPIGSRHCNRITARYRACIVSWNVRGARPFPPTPHRPVHETLRMQRAALILAVGTGEIQGSAPLPYNGSNTSRPAPAAECATIA